MLPYSFARCPPLAARSRNQKWPVLARFWPVLARFWPVLALRGDHRERSKMSAISAPWNPPGGTGLSAAPRSLAQPKMASFVPFLGCFGLFLGHFCFASNLLLPCVAKNSLLCTSSCTAVSCRRLPCLIGHLSLVYSWLATGCPMG